ncbi:MAG: multi-sensor signal transduction histidine kinase, partial [Bacteroidota bacterium]|nr:multi-sensor signal transduction histidine kinase [Bacteroidota bacterium]
MKAPQLFSWFRNISISRKLYFTVGLMALLICLELFTLFFSIKTLSSVRAYVGGEGLWSKAQKDGIYQLLKYGSSRNEDDYKDFQEFMKVPLGDAKTLATLSTKHPDMEIARQGFIEGRNHPDDVDGMINLFSRFSWVSYIHKAIEIWAQASPNAVLLVDLGEKLHNEINEPRPSQEKINSLLQDIQPINKRVTVLEDDFSYTLGEGSRWLEALVLKLLFAIALTVEITGLLLAISVSRGIQKGLAEIIASAKSFALGSLGTRARVFSQDEIGSLAQSFNLMSDKFEHKISELQSEQNKFKGLLESAPDAIVIVDENGVIKLINTQTENLFGYNRDFLLGQNVEILIPERFTDHVKHRSQYFSNPKTRAMGEGMQLFGRKKSKEEFPIEISLSPLETEEGLLVSAAIRDISERKKAEAKLSEYTAELEIKNKELAQFAYVASHDLQEPLRSVSSFIDLLNKEHGDRYNETEKQYMSYIVDSAHRMKTLIKALLDYSRIGRNTQLERVDCNVLVNEVIEDLDASIKANNATVKVGKLPVIMDYPTDIKLLFQNLIGNAIKFREVGTSPLVNVMSEKQNGFWKFSVK